MGTKIYCVKIVNNYHPGSIISEIFPPIFLAAKTDKVLLQNVFHYFIKPVFHAYTHICGDKFSVVKKANTVAGVGADWASFIDSSLTTFNGRFLLLMVSFSELRI